MELHDILFGDEDLKCSESFGYDDVLYNSPACSDDSGFGQATFSLEDILLSDPLPSVVEDEDFTESFKNFDRSNSVSSSNHDHSYSITDCTNQQSNHEIKLPELPRAPSDTNKGVKRRNTDFKENGVPLKKTNVSDLLPSNECNINIIQCDDDTFSYKDENDKIVIVDRSRKNAEMAKLNRQRKKRYISNLESEVKSLKVRNDKLMVLKSQHEKKIDNLENEVAYLMSIIRNQTKLSSVLKAVSSVSGISIGNEQSNQQNGKPIFAEHLPGKRAPVEIAEEEYTGGVCLHVSENKVTLEFCSKCNKNQS